MKTHEHMSTALSLKGLRGDVQKIEGFNAKIAVIITRSVGTMAMAYLFCVIALASLPAVLAQSGVVSRSFFPHWLISPGLIVLVAWMAQTFIQLVLLAVIMVGQSVQSAASDARSSKTFEDTEKLLDLMNAETEGGIKVIIDKLNEQRGAK